MKVGVPKVKSDRRIVLWKLVALKIEEWPIVGKLKSHKSFSKIIYINFAVLSDSLQWIKSLYRSIFIIAVLDKACLAKTRKFQFFSNKSSPNFRLPSVLLSSGSMKNQFTFSQIVRSIWPFILNLTQYLNVLEIKTSHVQRLRKCQNDILSWIVETFAEFFEIFLLIETFSSFCRVKKSPWRMVIKSGNHYGFS